MKYKTYTPTWGENILHAAEKAVKTCKDECCEVRSNFNGIEIIVGKNDQPSDVIKQYNDKLDDRQKAYEKSPEYKQHQIDAEIRRKNNQESHDKLMESLGGIETESDILDWLYEYVPLVDNIYVKSDRPKVYQHLSDLGYIESDNLGEDKEFYKNKTNFARYIIGQVMNCWHPCATGFIEKYRKL